MVGCVRPMWRIYLPQFITLSSISLSKISLINHSSYNWCLIYSYRGMGGDTVRLLEGHRMWHQLELTIALRRLLFALWYQGNPWSMEARCFSLRRKLFYAITSDEILHRRLKKSLKGWSHVVQLRWTTQYFAFSFTVARRWISNDRDFQKPFSTSFRISWLWRRFIICHFMAVHYEL